MIYAKIVASLANTSAMIEAGRVSTFRPLRACRSSTRGWSQRTMPVVLMPQTGTAKPMRRVKTARSCLIRLIWITNHNRTCGQANFAPLKTCKRKLQAGGGKIEEGAQFERQQ